MNLTSEIPRLFEYPGLFPSESLRIRFLHFIALDSDLQLCEAIGSLVMESELQGINEGWRKDVSRKRYLEGTRGWENFLMFDAPGIPLTSERTEPKSMVQAMPPIASRIVADFEREEQEILRFVQTVWMADSHHRT